jgi:hypothetical protein
MSAGKPGRPTKEAQKAGFEAEVLRLHQAGKPIGRDQDDAGTICGIMKAGKSTIFEIIKKHTETLTASQLAEEKRERKYQKQTSDEFMQEPVIKEWIEDMRLRRVGGWRAQVGYIEAMCQELQIYPDQLVPLVMEDGKRDFTWAKKWLASKAEVPMEKLRHTKIAYRGFAHKYGANDYELTQIGFDAMHYGLGKWKHVQLTEEQIQKMIAFLSDPSHFQETRGLKEALFAFRFGIDTCRPLEPIWNLTADRFAILESEMSAAEKRRIELIKQLAAVLPSGMAPLFAELLNVSPEALVADVTKGGKKILYSVNLRRKKTQKSGSTYKTAYMAKATYELALDRGKENGGRLMNDFAPEEIYPFLRAGYEAIGASAIDPDEKKCPHCEGAKNKGRVPVEAAVCPLCGGHEFEAIDYFQEHPIHALRHCGAQRLLQTTNYNRAVTAKLGGWDAEKTLEDHYGGVPDDVVRTVAGSLF